MHLFETFLILFLIQTCGGFSNYEIFKGFGVNNATLTENEKELNHKTGELHKKITDLNNIKSSSKLLILDDNDTSASAVEEVTMVDLSREEDIGNQSSSLILSNHFLCPEEEVPSNIGPYVVPTERDLVLHIGKVLARMSDNYHRRSLNLLDDVKEASKATIDIETSKCTGIDKILYRQCVKRVSSQIKMVVKNLVGNLEHQKQNIQGLLEGKICTLGEISNYHSDPIDMLRTLSVEGITLQLGLPGFLRMLSTCIFHCNGALPRMIHRRDNANDILMKYMLSAKDYAAIITKMNELNL